MLPYENLQIIEYSLNELEVILDWIRDREKDREAPVTVLIGGWAVDAYNPWYGSIDIDLVTNRQTRDALMIYLRKERGYTHYRLPGVSSVAKATPAGKIIIDFASKEGHFLFAGRSEELNFDTLDGHTVEKKLRGKVSVNVPERSLLLLFKLKACWDREYRIRHGTSHDLEWEQGKLTKDYADVLSLLDPAHGGRDLNLEFLGRQFTVFEFLKGCLGNIPDRYDGIDKYGKLDSEDAKEIVETLLALI
jgi:hypothetical protein